MMKVCKEMFVVGLGQLEIVIAGCEQLKNSAVTGCDMWAGGAGVEACP